MTIDRKTFKREDSCVVVVRNSYGYILSAKEMKVVKVGLNHLTVKGDSIYYFYYSNSYYNALFSKNFYGQEMLLFKDRANFSEFVIREHYVGKLRELFCKPTNITLNTRELKNLYNILTKEINNGTK